MLEIILIVLGVLLGAAGGYLVRYYYGKAKLSSSEAQAKKLIAEAQAQAELKKKEAVLEAKETVSRERRTLENEFRDERHRFGALERRLNQKEESLERKLEILEKKEKELQDKERIVTVKDRELTEATSQVNKTREEQRIVLERIAGMSADEAKKILMQTYEEEVKKEFMIRAKNLEQEAKENADRRAKEIIAATIQRVAAEHTVDMTVSTIPITNDELKGRVIGREGRNIRAFEQATGVDLIVDDTPEALTISAFDPVRREIARISLERLIADGRIHPTRIEEVVNKVKDEMEGILKDTGEKAALEVGVVGLPAEILRLLGKLKFRTSYGQNQLQHTMEVAWLSSVMASELHADVAMCKKAALLHDIGKAVDQEVEGTHHQISADIAKKYGESEKMINIILSHHEGIAEPKSVEAFIIAACDAISAARPGARRESAEHYIKRLEKLEKVATGFKGVSQAYAIQAGREIRVMVEPEEVNDQAAYAMAKDVARKIEQELEYPGQIKVVVVREIRAQEIAK